MEQYGLLDPLSGIHLYALHYIHLPHISRVLSEFQQQHNHHALRTEHNCTPIQIFLSAPRLPELDVIDHSIYGVEEDGPTPDIDPEYAVIVPPINVHRTSAQQAALQQINSLANDYNYGIDLYLQVLVVI